jgi:hypothetical protein
MTSPTPISRRGLIFLAGAIPTLSVVAPTIAWSDDSQIVSTVADAALAVAHAGGSPSAYKELLVRYAAVQGVALFALGRYRSQLPAGKRGQYVALATDYAAKMLSRYSKSFAGERFVVKERSGRGRARPHHLYQWPDLGHRLAGEQ